MIYYAADTKRWINAGLTLVHRLRCWTNVNQHWLKVLCLLGMQDFPARLSQSALSQVDPANTTSYQLRRRWADVVQTLYKCFVFAGESIHFAEIDCLIVLSHTVCWIIVTNQLLIFQLKCIIKLIIISQHSHVFVQLSLSKNIINKDVSRLIRVS